MKQKDIYLANLNLGKNSEQSEKTLVVIISGNAMNNNMGGVIVCPVLPNIKHYAACVTLKKDKINNLEQDSEIITFQIRTISKNLLVKKIGQITGAELNEVFKGLNTILNY